MDTTNHSGAILTINITKLELYIVVHKCRALNIADLKLTVSLFSRHDTGVQLSTSQA